MKEVSGCSTLRLWGIMFKKLDLYAFYELRLPAGKKQIWMLLLIFRILNQNSELLKSNLHFLNASYFGSTSFMTRTSFGEFMVNTFIIAQSFCIHGVFQFISFIVLLFSPDHFVYMYNFLYFSGLCGHSSNPGRVTLQWLAGHPGLLHCTSAVQSHNFRKLDLLLGQYLVVTA